MNASQRASARYPRAPADTLGNDEDVDGRKRVAAIIVRDGSVLMVRERGRGPQGRHDGPEYWTLPGGGVHDGEDLAAAVRREVLEETDLTCTSVRAVFEFPYPSGWTTVFRVEVDPASEPVLGTDHDLECDCPRMVGLDWIPLTQDLGDDAGLAVPVMLMRSP
ncbi:NUDIX domain-containing protein [Cellulomonas sp. zg-ZUI199]|uniref:NUDIX domain-containing protein n=1 Tax=Cellulomonas wangleii TaxID=2816956 RepID=A0ABX8D5J8_9CELL|nr:NUDIX domain-containing protein [Cellulomonas wangleii]MBO0898642.1 NUDIX domain-containing protein [Cellulomonas sp. zg-ZUI22]MBO0924354.1 NUDIX domain-containing protein [Cellulomonas wangleii]QVI62356.1 NUDIX domain-containing protein [Cellulomonas wangleii]